MGDGVLRFGACELDLPRREISLDGDVCHVEPQVFDVLAYLVRNRDRVVPKNELLDEVWGSRFVSEAALTSRIKSARQAVGDNGRDQRVIRTIHGRGYRFVGPVQNPAPVISAAPVLAGRAFPLERLQQRLTEAGAGHRRTVLITGEAGIGKTALVEAFVAGLDPATVVVARGRCPEPRGAAEPYLPLFDALSRLCRGTERKTVLDVLAAAAPSWLVQMPSVVDDDVLADVRPRSLGASPARMQRELVDAVEMLAAERQLVLVLDDLHWADRATVGLFEQLARRTDPAGLLLIGTTRSADAAHDEFGSVARDLVVRGCAEELALRRLQPGEVEEIVGMLTPGLAPAVAPMVHARTAGVPLFVRDLVSSWIDTGAVRPADDGEWAVAGHLDALERDVPPSAALLVEQGLDRLDADDVETLEAAAVAGDDFSASAVAIASRRSEEDVEARCAALARRGLFLRPSGDRFSFIHQLHRQVLYQRVTPRRRARYHGAVGAHLEEVYGAHVDEHVGELAMHFDRAGDAARAVEYLRRAAEQAIVRGVHADAHGHLDTARRHLDRLPPGESRLRAELHVELVRTSAMIVTHGWGAPELEAGYRHAAALCDELGDPPERPVVTVGLATLDELCGRHRESAAAVAPLIGSRPTSLVVETYELLACSAFHLAQYERAIDYALQGLSQYQPDHPNEAYARHGVDCGVLCHGWAAFASWFLGAHDEADRHIETARVVTEGQPYAIATASILSAFFHQYRDEPDRVQHWAETSIALATEHGYPYRLAQGHALRGWARAASGDAAGLDELRAGVDSYAASGATVEVPYYHGLIADVLVRMDRRDEALTHVDAALAAIEVHPDYFYAPTLRKLRAAAAG